VEQLLAPQRPAPAQKDIEEILRILNAATQRDIASGRPSSLEDAAARIATLPPSEQTSELYEKLFASVRAFYRGRPGGVVSAANKLSDIYRTMIQHDCMPTAKTFEHVICTLCEADAEDLAQTGASSSAPAHAGFRLDQAVMLLSGAHAASRYFERVDAYTAVLRACAARGRYEGAQTVTRLMDANPGLQRVTPSTTAYINLLDATSAVGSSSAQPASSQERAERLRTCVSISESYEELARAKQRWTELRASRIGDALMLAHMRLGDVPGALRLLETRTQERHDKPWDGTAASAATTGQTMSVVCEGFIDIGDLASASIWLEKLTTLSQAPTGSASFPLPEMEVLCRYLTALTGDEGAAKAKQEPSSSAQQVASILPQLRVVNTVFAAALAAPPIGSAKSNELNRLVVLHQLLRANAQAASQLFAKGRHDADVDALLDASLSHIHTYYSGYAVLLARTARNLATSTQAWPANKWVTNRQHGAATSALYLAATATVLVERSRHVDAASVLTYAAHAVPQVEAKGPVAWRQQRDHAVRAVRGVALDILAPAAESVVPSKVLLLAAVEYIWPALREHGDLPPQIVSRVASLYHQVCAEEDIHAVGLTESAWPRLLDALVHEETARPVDPQWLRQHGLVKFLSHASRLAADARPSLTAQAIDALAQRYGQDGSAFAQEYSTGRLQPSDPSEAPVQDASASPSAAPAAETSQDAEPVVEHDSSSVSSPLSSTATSLPSSASQGTSDHAAPIAKAARSDAPKKASTGVIDKKLGQWVSSRLNDAVGKIGSKRIPRAAMNDVNNFWRLVQTRAAEGVLAPLDSLLELLNVFGRNQMLQDVHTAYQLGMRVLHLSARKAANRTEQQQELDDAMIRALAHGGDVPAAAAHRHILINGGGRPSSDSYAALIANLHDTTDDALIAQELFEESQRLGIRPNTFLFNTVISKFARARKADLAVRLFEEMTSEPLRLRATTITYGAVINACTKTGDALGAERYFELMENDPKFEPRVPPYNTMMQFCECLAWRPSASQLLTKPDLQTARCSLCAGRRCTTTGRCRRPA
jgi:pentatricopeptide repeat protein